MAEEVKVEKDQYLTFMLDNEQYAIDVAKVKEVLEYTSVTKVPRTHTFGSIKNPVDKIRGVIPR